MSPSSESSSSAPEGRLRFDVDLNRYSDAPWEMRTDVSISVLTREGVLRGNDDGTYMPDRRLNRAEFVQIAIRLTNDHGTISLNCFPDIRATDWFADPVCRAKALGMVRGNADPDVPESMWRFEPSRDVQYEEAVKVLVQLYALPISGDTEGDDWYVPYLKAASDLELDIDGLQAGDRITRGEMARLVANFLAYSTGQLGELRSAEGTSSSSRQSTTSSSSRSSSSRSAGSMSSSSSSRSNIGSGQFDPNNDRQVRSSVLLLGGDSAILAGVKFFSNNEPVMVDEITVTLVSGSNSVSSLLIYTAEGELLGTATSVSGSNSIFRARIPAGRFELPRRENRTIYVRARLKDADNGGVSGENIQVASVQLDGQGVWSNEEYSTTSSDSFLISETAIGGITKIENVGPADGVITSANGQLLGQFKFTGGSSDDAHEVRVTGLTFTIEQTGGVTLSNAFVRTDAGGEQSNCTVSSSTVTCSSIPASIGEVDGTKTIRVYGDVSVPSNATNPSLRLVLSEPGTTSTAGAVTWTDGETTFTWVSFNQPVVQGTKFD